MMKIRVFLSGIGGLLLGSLLLSSCTTKAEEVKETATQTVLKEQAVADVEVMKLEKSVFNHEVVSNGKLLARGKADLRFQTSEAILHIWVKNGDHVRRGQKIAELDRQKLHISLLKARDSRERARLELQDVLIGQGYRLADSANIPPKILRLAQVKSGYDQACLEYQSCAQAYRQSTLTAPFDGIIANLYTKPYNMAPTSEAFCTVVDNLHLEADFTIMENELALIRKGDAVQVLPYAIDGVVAPGRIIEINPLVGENGLVRVKAEIANNRNQLFEGMNVRINVRKSMSAQWVVPKKAVVLRDGKQVVFTLKNGLAYWNYVKTGFENSASYTITEGLVAGDSVIVDGNLHLAHDAPVRVKR